MKSIHAIAAMPVTLAAALSLAACGPSEDAAVPEEDPTPVGTQQTTSMAPDGLPHYGVFRVTGPDGETRIMQNINENGTLINVMATEGNVPGTWDIDAEGNFCMTLEGEAAQTCYAEEMTDGVWTATNIADPEDVWTVERVMGSEVLPSE